MLEEAPDVHADCLAAFLVFIHALVIHACACLLLSDCVVATASGTCFCCVMQCALILSACGVLRVHCLPPVVLEQDGVACMRLLASSSIKLYLCKVLHLQLLCQSHLTGWAGQLMCVLHSYCCCKAGSARTNLMGTELGTNSSWLWPMSHGLAVVITSIQQFDRCRCISTLSVWNLLMYHSDCRAHCWHDSMLCCAVLPRLTHQEEVPLSSAAL